MLVFPIQSFVDYESCYCYLSSLLHPEGIIYCPYGKILPSTQKPHKFRKNGRSKTINTSFVESRNGKYRKDDTRLTRKTMYHSKKPKYHDAHINLLTAFFNYCTEDKALSSKYKEIEKPFDYQ